MQVLPKMDQQQLHEINGIIKEFLWNGKRAKISMEILQKAKYDGGAGLVNIEAKHKSLLIGWIGSLQSNKNIYSLARDAIGPMAEDNLVWRANISPEDANKLFPKENFWTQLIKIWASYNFFEPQSKETVRNQVIWLNSNIKVKISTRTIKECMKNELIYINNILDGNGRPKPFMDLDPKFRNAISWLEYRGIVDALPHYWYFALQTDGLLDAKAHKWGTDLRSHKVYAKLTEDESALVSSGRKWHHILGEDFEYGWHASAFKELYLTTNITKLRNFQFRLLHNKIFCNNILYHWRKVESQACEWCTEAKQNVFHLLWKCPCSQEIWNDASKFLGIAPNGITGPAVIYNKIHSNPRHVFNLVALVTKFGIFRAKCNNEKPHGPAILEELKEFELIEPHNAACSNNSNKHWNKWKPLIGSIDASFQNYFY